MARLIFFLTALLLAMPAIADDDNQGRSGEKKALQADCERQANQRNLIGKERKNFVKECTKEGKRAKRRYEKPAAAQPPNPVLTTEQKRQKCTEEVIRDKVPPGLRESFIKKCMER